MAISESSHKLSEENGIFTKEAAMAWQSDAFRVARNLFSSKSLTNWSHGRKLNISDLNKIFGVDSAPEGVKCEVCKCSIDRPYRAFVVGADGELVIDRYSGKPLARGQFVVRRKGGEWVVEAFCVRHLRFGRSTLSNGKILPAQSYEQACQRRDRFVARHEEERKLREKYFAEHNTARQRALWDNSDVARRGRRSRKPVEKGKKIPNLD